MSNSSIEAEADARAEAEAKLSTWQGLKKPVFIPAVSIIFVMIAGAALAANDSKKIFGEVNTWVTKTVGWWYILVVTFFVLFALYCAISRVGRIRLGRDDERPEFSNVAWLAMLFSAGMGIGLVFWGVAEPLSHLGDPPSIGGAQAEGIEAADQAMRLSLFHWGLHAWAIYVVVGLGIAYMTYRRGRPLSLRWLLEPLLGRARVEGWIGHSVDTMAIVGTLFGVATSLGLGVQQILGGVESLGWIDEPNNGAIIVLIAIITGIATLSVVSGLDKGLKWLSNINMGFAAFLLLFVLIAGPTLLLLGAWVGNLGGYFAFLPEYSLRMAPLDSLDPVNDTWLNGWTIFYWGWWMSWAPFVGTFIARISRGRTIREFVVGVLVAPTLIASIWFTVFGETGLIRQLTVGDLIGPDGAVDTTLSLFQMLETLPLATFTSILAIIVIGLFFITSSDSGSLVIDMLAHGGRTNTPRLTRVFWSVLEGLAAAVLLIAGGSAALLALQTASIITAVPISIILAIACVSLFRAFRYDLANAPDFLRIVAGPATLAPKDCDEAPAEDKISSEDSSEGSSEESMILAVKSIRPGMVGLSAGTGEMSRTDKPKLEDPLASEVFDTEEFANSAEGAARQEAAEAAAVADSAEADNKAAAPPNWG